MVKKTSKATIIKLLILLFIVMWLELIMVVKFFTEEYLVKGTIEKDISVTKFEYSKNTDEGDNIEKRNLNIKVYENINYDNNLNNIGDNGCNNLCIENLPENIAIDEPKIELIEKNNDVEEYEVEEDSSIKEDIVLIEDTNIDDKEQRISSRGGNLERMKTKSEIEQSLEISSIYQGYPTVGKIEIPKTGVNMYILSNQTVGGMEIAACQLYSTGELNKSGKTLIVGHNYRNGKLFSNNNKLCTGDIIKITTLDGIVKTYTIYDKIITTPEDVSFLTYDSNLPEIILSSCSDDNVSRVVIMAR